MNIIAYLFLGILIGVVFTYIFLNFIEPRWQVDFDVYKGKQTKALTKYTIEAQEISAEFSEKYPNYNQEQSYTNAIGFNTEGDEEYYYDEEDEEDILRK
jgi:hypothetical protein